MRVGGGEKSALATPALTRIAPDNAEPVIGRAFSRLVGVAGSNPTSPPKRGEVTELPLDETAATA
jgi:hypothetical protein